MVAIAETDLARLVCKVRRYERFLHLLQLHAEVTMNPDAMRSLIGNACRWSYAHRAGNGELSPEEQDEIIERAFKNLCKVR